MEPTDRRKYDPRIDVMRAIAFLLVTATHYCVTTWTDSIPDRHVVIDTVALGLLHTGWLGVPLFLFVSGYSLALGKCDPSYKFEAKQFFINRVLRIFPIWIVCILIVHQYNTLSGANIIALLFLQAQDMPKDTAFGIMWTIQLEFICYLLFPVLLSAVAARRGVAVFFLFFFLVRVLCWTYGRQPIWITSYDTVFGEGTIFLTGMIAASLRPLRSRAYARICLVVGVTLFCFWAVFIWKLGGYQNPSTNLKRYFLFMPEILAATMLLATRGFLAQPPLNTSKLSTSRILMFTQIARSLIFKSMAHIGKISYSGYMFSLIVAVFWMYFFNDVIHPGGWLMLIVSFITYLIPLVIFATVSYNAIELPFLRMRRQYVHLSSQAHSAPHYKSE